MKGCRPTLQLGSHIHTPKSVGECEAMSPHTLKWTPTLEIEIQWPFESSENILTGQNSLDGGLPYAI
jgi:hypothetical protein